jgi:hypothetical protein
MPATPFADTPTITLSRPPCRFSPSRHVTPLMILHFFDRFIFSAFHAAYLATLRSDYAAAG